MSVARDLRSLVVHRGFRRLFTVRVVSQLGDGAFQAGLATLFFFSPERLTTASDVAAAFAVLLLPFTVVGPFAGVLLDRWRRRQVLLVGNAVRVGLALVLAVLLVTVGVGPAVYVVTLVTLSINRFLLSALSAGLPRVVPADQLLVANTVSPTVGAVAYAAGGAIGFLGGMVVPAGALHDAVVLVVAAAVFAAASLLALRIGRDELGPERIVAGAELRSAAADLLRGLSAGARHLAERRSPALALGAIAVHRFVYGATFIATLLIARNLLADPDDSAAGLQAFLPVLTAAVVGFGVAVVVTPLAHERLSTARWVVVCLGIGAVGQVVLAASPALPALLVASGLLGLGSQGAKIAVDTIVQRDTGDAFRGRAFALYDVTYNAMTVAAAGLAAAALPDTGWSRAVCLGLVALYAVAAVGFGAGMRRAGRLDDPERAREATVPWEDTGRRAP